MREKATRHLSMYKVNENRIIQSRQKVYIYVIKVRKHISKAHSPKDQVEFFVSFILFSCFYFKSNASTTKHVRFSSFAFLVCTFLCIFYQNLRKKIASYMIKWVLSIRLVHVHVDNPWASKLVLGFWWWVNEWKACLIWMIECMIEKRKSLHECSFLLLGALPW